MSSCLTVRYPPADGAWLLHPPSDPWGDGYVVVMRVELQAEGLSARRTVKLTSRTGAGQPDIVDFFHDLADHWHGWDGERTWRSLDASMWITARHDGLGRVCLTVEAGEQMRSLAADVRAHFADLPR